jgi:hypothetical protein
MWIFESYIFKNNQQHQNDSELTHAIENCEASKLTASAEQSLIVKMPCPNIRCWGVTFASGLTTGLLTAAPTLTFCVRSDASEFTQKRPRLLRSVN